MPTADEHREKYEHNKRFLSFIEKEDEYNDWQIIVIFYCVIHHLESLIYNCYAEMEKSGKYIMGFCSGSSNHNNREDLLQKTTEFHYNSKGWNDYFLIKQESIKQRYEYFFANKKTLDKVKRRAASIEAITKLTLKR